MAALCVAQMRHPGPAGCMARAPIAVAAAAAAPLRPALASSSLASSTCRLLPVQRQQQSSAPSLAWRHQQHQPRRRRLAPAAAAAAAAAPAAKATAAAATAFWPALVQAWNANPATVLLAAGACILGVSLSVFLLASIPTMLALRRSAHAMEALLHTLRSEVPDTAATLRLSGLELADCIQEVGALSTDLTEGVRATARTIVSAEQGIRQAGHAAGRAMAEHVLPEARDKVEAALQERAKLAYSASLVRDAAHSTRTVLQRLRLALAAGGVARGVARGLAGTRRLPRRPGPDGDSNGALTGAEGYYGTSGSVPRY